MTEQAPASSAPSAAALVKEVEKNLVVFQNALAPPAAAAQGAAASDAEEASDVDLAPVSKKRLAHPARPGLGTIGKKVMIRANHFLVDVADNNLFHYDVAINPESKLRQTNREVLNELIKLHGKTALGGKLPAYDGRKSLYTAGSLPFESEEFVVTLVDPEKKEKERAEREYKITIRIAGRTDLYHLQQFLRGRQRDMPQETIQVLDVVLRESPSWNYVTVSRSFFSTTFGHRGDIGEGLECWRGYYQSLRPTQMGLSLNIDISATSFFKPVTVIKFVEEFLSIRDTSRPLSDRDRVKIKKALRGVRIETSHQQDQIRRYKITGITPIPMSQLIFPIDEKGTRQTVVQYFWDKYNYRLKYGSWPCLQAGSDSRPVYLPMEVCKIVEGQRYSKKLNDKQVTNILRATCKRPQEREQSIRDMVVHNNYAEDKFAQEFGIKVCSDLVTVPARVLPPPLLKYHDSGREKTCAASVGQWNMINKKMINGGKIDNWTCLNFSRMRPEEVQRFCMDLTHMCNATGMNVNPRPFVEVKSAAPNHIENALRDVHRRATQMVAQQGTGNQLQLLIVILPDVSGSYGKIKRVCETDIGIVSQCCLPRHASRPNKQYLENVALTINVKVGGRNTVLERAFVRNGIPFVSEVPTIIFGADVTHPPPGEDSASSIAAVVASMGWPEITKYRGLVSAQPHRQEIIEDLFTVSKDPQKGHNVNGGMIRELLIAFCRKTGRRPERIIFYRDGVSEGQFSHVLLHEMDAIRKACASLEEGYLPPVTFVVVQKRHHTRLFPEVHGRRDMTDKSGNILPGTVVDQKICHPTEFDFYLCSHAGIQGTSRPTHYHVLYDENHFTADALQSLTNNLCYTYARCTRAVSVVPPAYYAHLAAFRACYYVEGESSDGGSTPGSSGQAVACGRRDMTDKRGSLYMEGESSDPGSSRHAVACEGPVETPQLSKLADNAAGSKGKPLIIRFELSGTWKKEIFENGIYLGTAAERTLKNTGVKVEDCFFMCGPKPLPKETFITESCSININVALIGGDYVRFKLEDWIWDRMHCPEGLFECIRIPLRLRRFRGFRGNMGFVICLSESGRRLLVLVLVCLERAHAAGYSFNGEFTLKDIYYIPSLNVVEILAKRHPLIYSAYRKDLDQLVSQVIDKFFMYEDPNGFTVYPMYIHNLVKRIADLPTYSDESCKSPVFRSLIVHHPGTKSSSFRVGVFTKVIIKFQRGFKDRSDKSAFAKALSDSTAPGWCDAVSDDHAGEALKLVYSHKLPNGIQKRYKNDLLGRFDYTKCVFSHCQESDLVSEAALFLLWPDQLPEVMEKVLMDFKPPSKAQLPSQNLTDEVPDWLQAEGDPETWDREVMQTSNVPRDLGESGYIKWSEIPEKNEIELEEIFF